MDLRTRTRARSAVPGLALALLFAWLIPNGAAAHPELNALSLEEDIPPGLGVLVNSPDDLAGFIPAVQWSGTAAVEGQTADLIYAGTGCTPASYAGLDVEGKIVLIDQFEDPDAQDPCPAYHGQQKAQWAENAGAIGIIQIDDDDDVTGSAVVTSDAPVLSVSNTAGSPLREAVVNGTSVNVTLKDTPQTSEPPPGIGVLVNDPADLAGFRSAIQWGGTAPVEDQTADLVYAGTGCTPANYAGIDVEGKIALIDDNQGATPQDVCQPTYTFQQKMEWAQQAGAIGLVQVERDEDVFAGGMVTEASIPGLAVANSLGAPIRDAVLAGTVVNVTLTDTREPLGRLSDLSCEGGMAGPFACDGVDLLALVPPDEFNGAGQSDLWGWTDPDTGDEYVMMGKTNGTGFFRVTDPANPVYVGEVPNPGLSHLDWHDVKVYANHAFIVSESDVHGMLVFDLTRLRDVEEPQQFEPDTIYRLNTSAHNIAINEDSGYAYIVGGNALAPDQCLSGLHIVDINDPKNPTKAGCYPLDGGPGTLARTAGADDAPGGYVHDTQCVIYHGPDEPYAGSEICFNASENKVAIVDVTDKLLPETLSTITYDHATYTHQGWLTEDHRFLLVNDELDVSDDEDVDTTRTIVMDVQDLENPRVHFIYDHGTRSNAHNNYVHEGLVYQSNYTSGLRVLDVAPVDDPDNPRLEPVAFFDTYPWDDDLGEGETPTFDGTWSNYPFFESGTIAVSGRGEGLFLLRLADGSGDPGDPGDPQGDVDVACADCPVEIRAGESGSAQVTVTNNGDADDAFDVTVSGVPDGWAVGVDPGQVSVPAGESRDVTVTIDVPRQERAGTTTLTVTATSATDETVSASGEVPVEVRKGRPSNTGSAKAI